MRSVRPLSLLTPTLLLLLLGACHPSSTSQPKIIGGKPVLGHEFDNVVALVKDNDDFCSGVLIHPQLVLTAASCIDPSRFAEFDKPLNKSIKVYVGPGREVNTPIPDGELHAIANLGIEPGYDSNPLNRHQLGFVVLEQPITNAQYPELQIMPALSNPVDLLKLVDQGLPTTVVGFGQKLPANIGSSGAKYLLDTKFVSPRNNIGTAIGNSMASTSKGDEGAPAFVVDRTGRKLVVALNYANSPTGVNIASYQMVYSSLCWIQAASGFTIDNSLDCSGASQVMDDAAISALDFGSMCQNPSLLSLGGQRTFSIVQAEAGFDRNDCAATASRLQSISSRNLNYLELSDVAPLLSYSGLESLQLAGNKLKAITALKRLSALKELDITGNEIPDTEIAALQAALPALHIIGGDKQGDVTSRIKFLQICKSGTATAAQKRTLQATFNELDRIFAKLNVSTRGNCEAGTSLLRMLGSLDLREKNITDLSPFESFPKLESLELSGNPLTDISDLETLPDLHSLKLVNVSLSANDAVLQRLRARNVDITFEAEIPGWKDKRIYKICSGEVTGSPADANNFVLIAGNIESWRKIAECRLMTIKLMGTRSLLFAGAYPTDFKLLDDMQPLESLSIKGVPVTDLTEISKLTSLTSLSLVATGLIDLNPLRSLTNLRSLVLRDNPFRDISPLATLTGLRVLDLSGTQVDDISALGNRGFEDFNANGTPWSAAHPAH